jgi:transposase
MCLVALTFLPISRPDAPAFVRNTGYSPDFNPIEKAFAKLKAILRREAKRTIAGLWSLIGRLVGIFTSSESENYFRSRGYEPT